MNYGERDVVDYWGEGIIFYIPELRGIGLSGKSGLTVNGDA